LFCFYGCAQQQQRERDRHAVPATTAAASANDQLAVWAAAAATTGWVTGIRRRGQEGQPGSSQGPVAAVDQARQAPKEDRY